MCFISNLSTLGAIRGVSRKKHVLQKKTGYQIGISKKNMFFCRTNIAKMDRSLGTFVRKKTRRKKLDTKQDFLKNVCFFIKKACVFVGFYMCLLITSFLRFFGLFLRLFAYVSQSLLILEATVTQRQISSNFNKIDQIC